MDLKVYEGYKHNSTNNDSAVIKSTAQTLSSFNQAFKTPNTQPTIQNVNKKPRIAMFIDVDNVGISRENLLEIIFYANGKYQIDQCRLYGFSEDTLPGIREIASEYNVETIGKMKFKQTGVNCLDSRLLIDAYECALNNRQKIDMIFLWCYPCDLLELFEKIRNLGVNTATIDNSIFDCKNKFVSQTFKLYSPYNFNLEQSTYGKVRNQPAEIAPKEDLEEKNLNNSSENSIRPGQEEISQTKVEVDNNSLETKPEPSPIDNTKKEEPNIENKSNNDVKPDLFDNDFVPPVLPRRTIVERSSTRNLKKDLNETAETEEKVETTEETKETEDAQSDAPSSFVEEIARKLNLELPSNDDITKEMEQMENLEETKSDMIRTLLRQAGFDDLLDGEKPRKYEDTIGDL